MVFKIVWTQRALKDYLNIVDYLETFWTEKEIQNFSQLVVQKLELLKKFPQLGSPYKARKNLRKTLIRKNVQLFYRIRPIKKQIELASFWDTRQRPDKHPLIK